MYIMMVRFSFVYFEDIKLEEIFLQEMNISIKY